MAACDNMIHHVTREVAADEMTSTSSLRQHIGQRKTAHYMPAADPNRGIGAKSDMQAGLHQQVQPPSTGRTVPVTKVAAEDARKVIGPPIS